MNKKQADKTYTDTREMNINFRISKAEKALIIAGAKRAKLSQSDYIMSLVRKDAAQ